jgi:sialic acid synthase SpsE
MPDQFDQLKGFSCHTPDIGFGVVAVSRGAEWLEYHTTFDRDSKGTDHRISLTIPELKTLGRSCAQIQKIKPRPIEVPSNEIEDRKRLKQ